MNKIKIILIMVMCIAMPAGLLAQNIDKPTTLKSQQELTNDEHEATIDAKRVKIAAALPAGSNTIGTILISASSLDSLYKALAAERVKIDSTINDLKNIFNNQKNKSQFTAIANKQLWKAKDSLFTQGSTSIFYLGGDYYQACFDIRNLGGQTIDSVLVQVKDSISTGASGQWISCAVYNETLDQNEVTISVPANAHYRYRIITTEPRTIKITKNDLTAQCVIVQYGKN